MATPLQYSCLGDHGQRSLAGYSPWGREGVRHDLATKQQQTHWIGELPGLSVGIPATLHPKWCRWRDCHEGSASWVMEGWGKDRGWGGGAGWGVCGSQMLMREDTVPSPSLEGGQEVCCLVTGRRTTGPHPLRSWGLLSCCSDSSHLPGPGWCWRGARLLLQSRPEKRPGGLGEWPEDLSLFESVCVLCCVCSHFLSTHLLSRYDACSTVLGAQDPADGKASPWGLWTHGTSILVRGTVR